ncbi:MAG: PD-(D/E)XK nuclease family protein [Synergistaceae bacterium]|nr:PD-(D/E)XK nuclease family protein [Synergistaceae bacterium]
MKTLSYNTSSDFARIIGDIVKEFAGQEKSLRFVIPSRKDKYLWPEKSLNDGVNLWTWQEIYEDIITDKRRRVLSPPDHILILKAILAEALEEHKDKIKSLPGLKRSGFLSVLSDDMRELMNEAVSPNKLTSNTESDNPAEFLLPDIYSRYLEYLERYSLLDSAQVYTAAYEEIHNNQEWGKGLVIVFAGFMSFNHGQLELVKAIHDRCRDVRILKPEPHMKDFHDSCVQIREEYRIIADETPAQESSGHIVEISSAEPGLESEIIARTLALWSAGEWNAGGEFPGFGAIGLMIDEGRQEAFTDSFTRYGIPYNLMEGITINHTLPGRILASLRHLKAKDFPAYDTAMLLTQPCFAGSEFPVMRAYKAGRSGLGAWNEYLNERVNDPNEKLHDVFDRALKAVEAIKAFCDFMDKGHTPAKIMTAFNELLNAQGLWLNRDEDDIAPYPELDESRRITASAIQTVSEKVLALDELMPDLGKVHDEKMSRDDAYEFLEDWCRNSHIRPPIKLSDSVSIYTGQPPVLSSFPVWIMTGITQKSWSPNIKSSPLLGNEEREKLRENEAYLPRTKEKAEQREALFRRLVMTGEKLTIISRPLLDDESRPVSESPFMKRFVDDMHGWKKDEIDSAGIRILLGSDGFTFPEIDAGEKIVRFTPRMKAELRNVGASDIQELLACPFLWWQKRKAKLFQPDSQLVSASELGNILHAFWESVWKSYRNDMAAPGKTFERIAASEWDKLKAAEGVYAEHSSTLKDPRLSRRLEAIKFRAFRLAGTQAEILDALHENYTHEEILLEDEAQMSLTAERVQFSGQCDRIEILRGRDGSRFAFIADYKEGRKGSKSYDDGMKKIESRTWNTEQIAAFKYGLQLSMYAAMFAESHDCDLSGVYILGHEDGKIFGTFTDDVSEIFAEHFPYDDKGKLIAPSKDIPGRISEGKYAMQCAVRILDAGEFAPEYDASMCRNCRIKSLCRKGEFKGDFADSDSDGDE